VTPSLCPVGFYCPATTSVTNALPQLCPLGSFCNASGLGSAVLCPPGWLCPIEGLSSELLPCPIGSVCPTAGLVAGVPCPRGQYCPVTGLVTGVLCPSGRFNPAPGMSTSAACNPCASNLFGSHLSLFSNPYTSSRTGPVVMTVRFSCFSENYGSSDRFHSGSSRLHVLNVHEEAQVHPTSPSASRSVPLARTWMSRPRSASCVPVAHSAPAVSERRCRVLRVRGLPVARTFIVCLCIVFAFPLRRACFLECGCIHLVCAVLVMCV
jgi:hypothetical protein